MCNPRSSNFETKKMRLSIISSIFVSFNIEPILHLTGEYVISDMIDVDVVILNNNIK